MSSVGFVLKGSIMTMADDAQDQIDPASTEDLARINSLLRAIGGPNVVWGAGSTLEVWLTEQRIRAEREASARLTRATWVLAIVTLVLAAATVALVVSTVRRGG